MKKTNTLLAFLFAPLLLLGQSAGFVQTYSDGNGFVGSNIVQTDTGFLVSCYSANATALLTIDSNGVQLDFEVLTENPPNDCTDESTTCPYPAAGAARTQCPRGSPHREPTTSS